MEKMKLKRFLVSIILIIVTLTSLNSFSNSNYNYIYNTIDTIEYIDSTIIYKTINKNQDDVKRELVAEVNRYINKQAPNAHITIPEHIVTKCLDNNIDICFVMSQTQIETNFGTTGAGRASSRRSMFGVASRRYNTYEHAIVDYINILKKSYLVKGRTEHDLMRNYVTGSGYRYAEDKRYESALKNTYNIIVKATNIDNLQQEYKKQS